MGSELKTEFLEHTLIQIFNLNLLNNHILFG